MRSLSGLHSIRHHLLRVLPPLVATALIVSAGAISIAGRQIMREQTDVTTRPVAEATANAVAPLIAGDEQFEIQRLVDQLSANRPIESISVWSTYRFLAAEMMISIVLTVIVTIVVAYIVLQRILLGPITSIAHAAAHEERDALRQIHAEPQSEELSSLSGSLLQMLERIDADSRQLERHADRLETTVAERTRELEESLDRLKGAQAAVVRQEKLASLGQLSAGIAHEINNPTAYVRANLRTLVEVTDALIAISDRGRRLAEATLEGRGASVDALARELLAAAGDEAIDDLFGDGRELVSWATN